MLNKNKALTNFICGYVTSLLMIILFTVLAQTSNDWIGDVNGTNTQTLSAIAFGVSFFVILIVYAISTLIFASSESAKKSPLPLFLSSLMMSLAVAFGVGVIDLTLNRHSSSIVLAILIGIVFLVSITALMWFIQEFNTKFVMGAISKNRADEWEFTNFLSLSFNRISVEHKSNYTELKYKGKRTIVYFIPEDIIERKSFLSGDLKDKLVIEIESKLNDGEKGLIVYLSNNLPIVEGTNDKVSIIKHNELFNIIKAKKDSKNGN